MARPLVTALAVLLLAPAAPAFARVQDPATPGAAPTTAPTAAPADVLTALGRERISAEMLDLEPAGDPVLTGVTAKGDVILRAPMRLRGEGRLAADIATDSHRMAAGAPVSHRQFKQRSPDLAEAVQAWCGPGEQRTMFGWAGGITVCMVHTSDGKANLGAPLLSGAWWMASHVGFTSPDARTERVDILPPETPSEFSVVFVYERLRTEGVAVHSAIEGPGLSPEARPYRYRMPRRVLPLTDGVATLDYDGYRVRLTPERRGDVVAATGERFAAPADFRILRDGSPDLPGAPGEETDTDAIDALAPTPFVIGAVKLDPAKLVPADGVVARGGALLSGQADYAVTARLAKPLNLRAPLINDTAPEGLILHQVEFAVTSPLGARSMTRIWCGPIGVPTIWSRERVTMCMRRGGPAGWEAFWPVTGRPWLGTTQSAGNIAALQARGLELEISPTPLMDPLGFRVELQRVTDTVATLRLVARRGDQDAVILSFPAEFENGVAVMPLWSHRLTLTRSGAGVTAALSPDGDGAGPTDDGYYP